MRVCILRIAVSCLGVDQGLVDSGDDFYGDYGEIEYFEVESLPVEEGAFFGCFSFEYVG